MTVTKTLESSLTAITFFADGVASLLGWSVVLNSLDYFKFAFPEYSVDLTFPILNSVACVMFSVLFNIVHKRFTCRQLVYLGTILTIIGLVGLLLAGLYMKHSLTGYLISLLMVFMLGFSSNMVEISFYSIANYMTPRLISSLQVGVSLSGLVITVIRMIVLAVNGNQTSDSTSMVMFFLIAIGTNIVDLLLNYNLFQTEMFHVRFEQYEYINKENEQNSQQKPDLMDTTQEEHSKKYLVNLYKAHVDISPVDIVVFFLYIQTFMLFPAQTLSHSFNWGGAWPGVLLIFCYGVGDTLGRIFASFRPLFNSYSVYYVFFTRFFFFWTIPILTKQSSDSLINNSGFAFVNQVLFGFTNGMVTKGAFVIMYQKAKLQNKLYAAVLYGLAIQFGIMFGSFIAYGFNIMVAYL